MVFPYLCYTIENAIFQTTAQLALPSLRRPTCSPGQNQLAIHAAHGEEAHLAIPGVEFVQALQGAACAVADPVVAEIAEGDGNRPRRQFRHIG